MNSTFRRGMLVLNCLVVFGVPWMRMEAADASGIVRKARLDLTQTSVFFEPNVGQADPGVRFVGRAARYSMLLEAQAMTFLSAPLAEGRAAQAPLSTDFPP